MASGALDWKRRFIKVGQSFPRDLPGSWALRWLALEMVLGAIIASPSFTWLLSLPTWGLMWMDKPASCTILQPIVVK
jgi:hypothetical protein